MLVCRKEDLPPYNNNNNNPHEDDKIHETERQNFIR